ncbi:hypothetical protein GOBAR_AA12437 [Gossypium barbadense]|uniref:Uncharacterized protein n=1 Tax=Gossypium barbadense TaxID=3634 RepID=A0A2P5XXY7_GOSBA|nr:hypothetical protein GOBAR_AA12437 [Gossypium barbadense]
MKEFKEENDLNALNRHIHHSPLKCWDALAPSAASYNPNCSKASVLPLSLKYLHAIFAHTLTGRGESTGVINTHDAYFLCCMSHGHVIDLAYFVALTIQHQTERHKKRGLKTPLGKVLYDCHVLLDHDHNHFRYNILLAQDLSTNEPLPPLEYPPPPLR